MQLFPTIKEGLLSASTLFTSQAKGKEAGDMSLFEDLFSSQMDMMNRCFENIADTKVADAFQAANNADVQASHVSVMMQSVSSIYDKPSPPADRKMDTLSEEFNKKEQDARPVTENDRPKVEYKEEEKNGDVAKANASPSPDASAQGAQGFLCRIGFSAAEAKEVVKEYREGNRERALKRIEEKIASLPANKRISVTRDELKSFFGTFGVSAEDAAKFGKLFDSIGDNGSGEINADDLKKIAEIIRETHGKRGEVVDNASGKGGVNGLETRIQDNNGNHPENGQAAHQVQSGDKADKPVPDQKHIEFGKQQGERRNDNAFSGFSGNGKFEAGSGNEKGNAGRENFVNNRKAGSGEEVGELRKNTGNEMNRSVGFAGVMGQNGTSESGKSGLENVTYKQVVSQVENGILKNLGQGRKQLTLELRPEELGTLKVVLTIKDKEVQAVINTDNADASQALNQGMAELKKSLEEQGLKVSKLEVRTQLSQEFSAGGWQGEKEHNLFREKNEKSGWQSRLNEMRREIEDTAREMQKEVVRANISHTGIDVFA